MALLAVVTMAGCASTGRQVPPPKGAGFRYSVYGPPHDPGPEYWARTGVEMAKHFDGAVPEAIWIVGKKNGNGILLNFPARHAIH